MTVPKLWSLAQTRIFPILRSRYERVTLEIKSRQKNDPFPTLAAKAFRGHLDIVIGYDHGQTISRIHAATATEWDVPLDEIIHRARANLRALPIPVWLPAGDSLWKLESEGGYAESLLQLPEIFDRLPAKGTPLAMIPNPGVLLATGTDESRGLAALFAAATKSILEGPWPPCGDLFEVTPTGIQDHVPDGPAAKLLATIQRLEMASVYDAQKAALRAHHEALYDAVYVASYRIVGKRGSPNESQSWCSWTHGVPSLLPTTDLIVFVWDLNRTRKTAPVPWTDAERLVGHYFKSTAEDPARTRVDAFPTPDELAELQRQTV